MPLPPHRYKPTSALGPPGSKKREVPTKKKTRGPAKKPKMSSSAVVDIQPQMHQKGDDERRAGGFLRAPPGKNHHDFKVNVDPSFPTDKVPENDPPAGVMDHPAARAIQDDGSMSVTAQRNLGDEISSTTDATKRMGATLPSSQKSNIPNLLMQTELAMINQKETRPTIPEAKEIPSGGPNGVEAKALIDKGADGPTQDPMAPQQAQRAAQNDTLRPLFGMANPMDVVPSTRDQIKSGILFNDFHIVAPGHGLGATNKLFLMDEMRESQIRYREPLAFPRTDIGPTNTVLPPPLEFQNNMTRKDVKREQTRKGLAQQLKLLATKLVGEGSLNVLGDDYGLMRDTSAKGLPRPEDSPFEPLILKPQAMERVRPLCGSQLDSRHLRRIFDTDRYPEHFTSHMAQEGGSHFSTRNALKLLPFPLGVA